MRTTDKGFELLFSFFAENEQIEYQTPHELVPQNSDDTCVAACVRMILNDFGIFAPESYIASALETSDGAFLSQSPQTLKDFGLSQIYEWRKDLNLSDLSKSLKQGNAIVSVKRKGEIFGHALVVDAIFDSETRLRDPLPRNEGQSYAVTVETFSEVFFRNGETGFGVIKC